MSQSIDKFLSDVFYRVTVAYPVIISDVLVMIECARKFIETRDFKHVQHMCTIANTFLKKVGELLKYCEHELQQVVARHIDELSSLYNAVLRISISGEVEDVVNSVKHMCVCLVRLCRELSVLYSRELEKYLREVESKLHAATV